MKIILRLVLLAIVILAGVWLWTVFFPDAQKMIRQQLAAVARNASSNPNQNPLVSAANAQLLAGHFSTNVEVQLDVPGRLRHTFNSRDEIAQAAIIACSSVNGIKVEFLDVNVTVGPDKQSAVADLTLKAQAAGDKEFIVQEMKITLQKSTGKWLITRVETVRTLS
jgi:cytoskeletal protein RodZ